MRFAPSPPRAKSFRDRTEEEFDKHEVWRAAWARLHNKMLALQENKSTVALRFKARGEELPNTEKWGDAMSPIATLTPSTLKLSIDTDLKRKIRDLGKKDNE